MALEPEGCRAAMDPSSGGRVGAEPARGTWLGCSENPVAVGCSRATAVVDGRGGGAGVNAVEDAANGRANCAST